MSDQELDPLVVQFAQVVCAELGMSVSVYELWRLYESIEDLPADELGRQLGLTRLRIYLLRLALAAREPDAGDRPDPDWPRIEQKTMPTRPLSATYSRPPEPRSVRWRFVLIDESLVRSRTERKTRPCLAKV